MSKKTIEKPKVKSVRIALELPVSFIRVMQAKVELSGWSKVGSGESDRQLDPAGILTLLVCMAARGAFADQIHAAALVMWRDSNGPRVLHDKREVVFE